MGLSGFGLPRVQCVGAEEVLGLLLLLCLAIFVLSLFDRFLRHRIKVINPSGMELDVSFCR